MSQPPYPNRQTRIITDRLDIPEGVKQIRVLGSRSGIGVSRLVEYLHQFVAQQEKPPQIIDGGVVHLPFIAATLGLSSSTAQPATLLAGCIIVIAHETTTPAEKNHIITAIDTVYSEYDCSLPHIIFRKRGMGDEADRFGKAPSQLITRILHEIAQQIFPPDSMEAEQAKQLFSMPLDEVRKMADPPPEQAEQRDIILPEQIEGHSAPDSEKN